MSAFISRIVHGPEDQRAKARMEGSRRWKLLASYLPDWIITIVLLALVAYFTDHSGFKREFSLTDTSIQHTFAVKERISFGLCIGLAAGVPAAIIVVVSLGWRRSFWDLHNGILSLLLSVAIATAITNIIKVSVGRPRPDLIDRCKPAAGSANGVPYGLVTVAICTNLDSKVMDDGFKSFVSGHSSFAFAGLGMLSLYLSGKMHLFDRRGYAIKAWISLIPLMGASLIAISRTMDYRHHPTDVLFGGLIGFWIAVFTYHLYYPSLFSPVCHLPYSPRIPSSAAAEASRSSEGSARPLHPEQNDYTTPDVLLNEDLPPRGTVSRPVEGRGAGPILGMGAQGGGQKYYDNADSV